MSPKTLIELLLYLSGLVAVAYVAYGLTGDYVFSLALVLIARFFKPLNMH